MLFNRGVGEDSWTSLGLQGDSTSPPKENQSWRFTARTDAEVETPILWPTDAKSWLIWKDPDAGKDWGQEEKAMIEDEMVEWDHWLNAYEFVWSPRVGDGQGVLTSCSSWAHKELNMTEQLNWTEVVEYSFRFLSFFFFLLVFFSFVSDGQYFYFSLEDIPLWMLKPLK